MCKENNIFTGTQGTLLYVSTENVISYLCLLVRCSLFCFLVDVYIFLFMFAKLVIFILAILVSDSSLRSSI